MPVFEFSAFGAPAIERLRTAIDAAQDGDRLRPVTVVVPSNIAGLHLRRRLVPRVAGDAAGLVNVRFSTLPETISLLGAKGLSAERARLTPPANREATRMAMRGLDEYRDHADHEATVAAFARTLDEVRRCPAGAEALEGQPALGRLFAAYRGIVAPRFHDGEDVAEAALAAIREGEASFLAMGAVVVYLPEPAVGRAAEVLRAMLGRKGSVVIVGISGEEAADRPAVEFAASLGYRGAEPTADPAPAGEVRCAVLLDAREEARFAAAEAVRLVGLGVEHPRIAILSPGPEPHAALVDEALATAGLPVHGRSLRRLGETPVGRALEGLLRLRRGELRRADVIDWVCGSPLEWGRKPIEGALWDRISREAGVTRGLKSWEDRLSRYARARRAEAPEEAAEAERMWGFVQAIHGRLQRRHATWGEAVRWLAKTYDQTLRWKDLGENDEKWHQLVSEGLESLLVLDRLEGEPDPETLARGVQEILEAPLTASAYGSGVFRGTPRDAMALDFDHVILVGMAEGAFPPRGSDDPVLPDAQRDPRVGPRRSPAATHRRAYLACRALAPGATLCAPRVDRSAERPVFPCPWWLAEATRLSGRDEPLHAGDLRGLAADWLHRPTSFEASIRTAPPATEREHHLRSLLAMGWDTSGHVLYGEAGFKACMEMQRERNSAAFGPCDGKVGETGWSRTLSATALERYAACPQRFYYTDVLRLRPTKRPKDLESVDGGDRGDLVHRSLKRFVDDGAGTVEAMAAIADGELDRLAKEGVVPPGPLWRRDRERIREGLLGFVKQPQPEVLATEWAFGTTVEVDGVSVDVSGCVDRVDAVGEGGLTVVDYKTGSSEGFKGLDEDPLRGGRLVQLPLYGMVAAREMGREFAGSASYAFLDKKTGRWESLTMELEPGEAEGFRKNLATIARGVQDGIFPARPGKEGFGGSENCRICDFARCCPTDRAEAWQRKRKDGALIDLIEMETRTVRLKPAPEDEEPEVGLGAEASPFEAPAPEIVVATEAEPVADDADDRNRVEFETDATLFVEAGAGTGKTTALVARIVALTTSDAPTPIGNLAAITFTKKAAGEVRERLRQAYEKAARGGNARARAALEGLDEAAVETIDAFARRLLSEDPLAAGLPPSFALMDDVEGQLRFEEWWTGLLEGLLEDDGLADVWVAALKADVDPSRLRSFAAEMDRRWERAPSRLVDVLAQPVTAVDEAVLPILARRDAVREAIGLCAVPSDKLLLRLREVDAWLGALDELRLRPGTVGDLLELLGGCPPRAGNAGGVAVWGEDQAFARGAVNRVKDLVDPLKASLAASKALHGLAPLLDPILKGVAQEAERRRRAGALTFHDLLVLATRLLRGDRAARDRARARYRRVLVDEFQDTDPLQVELLALIAGEEEPPAPRWERAEIGKGRLFFVGDPKQAIYRFRGAEPETYAAVRDAFGAGRRSLTRNFRSCPRVLAFVNEAFGRLLARDGQAPPAPLGADPAFPTGPDETNVHFLGGPCLGDEKGADALRRAEATELAKAARIAVLGGEEPAWRVREGAGFRPAAYRDVTILIPKRTGLVEIERALLAARVPYRIDSRSLLFATQEVSELLTLLRAVDDPTDEVALVATLRSSAFGCTDEEIFRHGRPWDYRGVEGEGSVARAMAELRRYHGLRHERSVAGLLAEVVRERRLMELAVARRRPREGWRRIGLLLDRAQAFDSTVGGTLRRFLDWADELAEGREQSSETVVEEEDDDAVRIMTIHASKGLEFPIVFAACLGGQPRYSESVRVAWRESGPEFRLARGVETARYSAAQEVEKDRDELEQDRLLYVAATRAVDHLVVGLNHNAEKPLGTMAGRLHAAMAPMAVAPLPLDLVPEIPEPNDAPLADGLAPFVEWAEARRLAFHVARPRAMRSPTRLAKELSGDVPPRRAAGQGDDVREEANVEARPRGGMDLGRAVHMALQTVDFGAGEDEWDRAVEAQAAAEGQEARTVRRLVDRARASAAIREAARRPHWKEAFLSASVEGVLVEGYADLIFQREDGEYVVVDYKTDATTTDEAVDRRMRGYRHQAATYALMLERTLGSRPAECRFVFVQHEGDNDRAVHDLDTPMEEVRERLRTLAAAD